VKKGWLVAVVALVVTAGWGGTAGDGAGAGVHRSKALTLTVEVNGDILVHSPLWEQALRDGHGRYDFYPMLRQVAPFIKRADLAICHVETPMTPRPPQGYPTFNTPTQLARAIHQTGWRICDTASNHSLDQGQYGIDQTGRTLDRAGVLHTGSFSSAAASRRILIVRVKGVKVAFLAYTEFTNGIPLPNSWSVNLAHVDAVRRDARRARRLGARVVIVNFHWGTEYQSQPDSFQLATAQALAPDPDITAIVGQHPHVVEPIRPVDGKLVVFSEGQILSDQTQDVACCPIQTQEGMMVYLHFSAQRRRWKLTGISYRPTIIRHPDYTVLEIGAAWRGHVLPRSVLQASYDRTTAVVGRIPQLLGPLPSRLR
jgi:hypothetical protein